jgi:hypothetical protein
MKTAYPMLAVLFLSTSTLAAQTAQEKQANPEKQKISFRVPASSTKYTQQHVLDVGDVPGHQVRLFELHRTFSAVPASAEEKNQATPKATANTSSSSGAPVFNGVRATEQWVQGVSDYVNANGRVYGYGTYIMENGDKIFIRYEGINQATATGKTNGAFINTILGGTGSFKELRGTFRANNVATFVEGKATGNDTQYEGEYWTER